MWKDVKEVYEIGLKEYVLDLWNLADIFTNICFTGWIVLRITAYIIVKKEESAGLNPYLKREDWHAYGGKQVKFWGFFSITTRTLILHTILFLDTADTKYLVVVSRNVFL